MKVAAIQMVSSTRLDDNLVRASALLADAAALLPLLGSPRGRVLATT